MERRQGDAVRSSDRNTKNNIHVSEQAKNGVGIRPPMQTTLFFGQQDLKILNEELLQTARCLQVDL